MALSFEAHKQSFVWDNAVLGIFGQRSAIGGHEAPPNWSSYPVSGLLLLWFSSHTPNNENVGLLQPPTNILAPHRLRGIVGSDAPQEFSKHMLSNLSQDHTSAVIVPRIWSSINITGTITAFQSNLPLGDLNSGLFAAQVCSFKSSAIQIFALR